MKKKKREVVRVQYQLSTQFRVLNRVRHAALFRQFSSTYMVNGSYKNLWTTEMKECVSEEP